MMLSAIIKEFEGRFRDRYQTAILPSHQKALWAMQQCRKESNRHMLARCTGCQKKPISRIPVATGAALIAKTMKAGNGSRLN